jgi:hypothetical protein
MENVHRRKTSQAYAPPAASNARFMYFDCKCARDLAGAIEVSN